MIRRPQAPPFNGPRFNEFISAPKVREHSLAKVSNLLVVGTRGGGRGRWRPGR